MVAPMIIRVVDGTNREIVVQPTAHPFQPRHALWVARLAETDTTATAYGETSGDAISALLQALEDSDDC